MAFWDADIARTLNVPVTEGEVVTITRIFFSPGFYGKAARKMSKPPVRVYVIVGREKIVVAHLHPEKTPYIDVSMAFDQSFQIFHNARNSSVHVCGYKRDEKPKRRCKPAMASY